MFPNNVVAESKGKDYFLVYVEINLMNSTNKRIRTEHSNPTSSIEYFHITTIIRYFK